MDRRQAFKALAGLALCPLCAPAGFAADWSYGGANGPDKWGDVDAASKVCSVGGQQSPIDIADTIRSQLPPLRISWNKRADTIVNNGRTIQLNFKDGNNTLGVGKDTYKLLQCHFHHPSEHLIAGKSYPMEVHFVHANEAGSLAVIGALMAEGRANPAFNKIASTMPSPRARRSRPIKASIRARCCRRAAATTNTPDR